MALKIRLRQQGRSNRPFYRLVLTDVRTRRDGKYIEALGWYNPFESEDDKSLLIKADRIQHWMNMGAQLSDCAHALVAKTAPQLIQEQTAKVIAHKAKMAAKRKARKKATAA